MSTHSVDRRVFLEKLGIGSAGAMMAGQAAMAAAAEQPKAEWKWQPASDRKIRFGIVGYGVCSMGAAFGLQDHPNVEVVAVSDLIPERCKALSKACRCEKTCESLEVLVKDPKIEAVFVATDAPSHARHCIDAMNHGEHVMTCVPAVWGSVEEAEQLVETVRKTGLRYMMAEASSYHDDCYAMRKIYEALAMTVPGITAHQSALKDGETLKVPYFDRAKG